MTEPRICPSCKALVEVGDGDRVPCPNCKKTVWFFNYEPIKPVPPPVVVEPSHYLKHLIYTITGLCVLMFLFSAIHSVALIIAVGIAGAGIGIAALEHASAARARGELTEISVLAEHNRTLQNRFDDARRRYGYLLATMQTHIAKIKSDCDAEVRDAQTRMVTAEGQVALMKARCAALGTRFVQDHLNWVRRGITANPETFLKKKHALETAAAFARGCELEFPRDVESKALRELEAVFRQKVAQQRMREEVRELKKQQADQAKAEAELRRAQAEEARIQAEIERRRLELEAARQADMARVANLTADLERMQQQLIDAKNDTLRAVSNAQLTRVGWVYVLSNIGSFGQEVFKIGLTRRFEYEERVRELSGAAVPFPFDVHAAIHSMDAPSLECALHKTLARFRVNRANPRKEFFRCDLQDIVNAIAEHHQSPVDYVMEPEASEYYESQQISDEQMAADDAALEAAGLFGDDDDDEWAT